MPLCHVVGRTHDGDDEEGADGGDDDALNERLDELIAVKVPVHVHGDFILMTREHDFRTANMITKG